jgi:hypothetical protein
VLVLGGLAERGCGLLSGSPLVGDSLAFSISLLLKVTALLAGSCLLGESLGLVLLAKTCGVSPFRSGLGCLGLAVQFGLDATLVGHLPFVRPPLSCGLCLLGLLAAVQDLLEKVLTACHQSSALFSRV